MTNCVDQIRSIMRTKQDNDVIDHKGLNSVEYDIELFRLIGQYAVNDEDGRGQRHDRSYKSALRRK